MFLWRTSPVGVARLSGASLAPLASPPFPQPLEEDLDSFEGASVRVDVLQHHPHPHIPIQCEEDNVPCETVPGASYLPIPQPS